MVWDEATRYKCQININPTANAIHRLKRNTNDTEPTGRFRSIDLCSIEVNEMI